MNAISYAVAQIKQSIPIDILHYALNLGIPETLVHTTSLDEKITHSVIRGIVLVDTNVIGGVQEYIPLNGITPMLDYYNNMVWNIPLERTFKREIVTPLSISSSPLGNTNGMYGPVGTGVVDGHGTHSSCFQGNYMTQQGQRVLDSYKGGMTDVNANVTLIGPNTVLLRGSTFMIDTNLVLKCILENDSNLNNIQPRSYPHFATGCIAAMKKYIYNKCIINLGRGYMEGGQELGQFQRLVESYESAGEEYDEFKSTIWGKVTFQNDISRKQELLSNMFPRAF